jgi:hypothetical protein
MPNVPALIGAITAISQIIKEFIPNRNKNKLKKLDDKFQELILDVKTELDDIGKKINQVRLLSSVAIILSGICLLLILILYGKG